MLLCYSCLNEALRVQAAQLTIDDGASMFSLLPHLFFFLTSMSLVKDVHALGHFPCLNLLSAAAALQWQ